MSQKIGPVSCEYGDPLIWGVALLAFPTCAEMTRMKMKMYMHMPTLIVYVQGKSVGIYVQRSRDLIPPLEKALLFS